MNPAVSWFVGIADEVSSSFLGCPTSVDSEVDFAVDSIGYYRTTDLGTGITNYVTEVAVSRKGVEQAAVLRLTPDNGRTIDTTWNGKVTHARFEFESEAPPVSAEIDPRGGSHSDINLFNNSLEVSSSSDPVLKWTQSILSLYQLALATAGGIL